VIVDDVKDKHPLWRTASDALLALLACAGMVFYFIDLENRVLVLVWRPISVLLLAGQIFINFYERNLALTGRDAAIDLSGLSSRAVWFADIFTMVVVLPALIINLIFALF
jgi:hypothetical protein